MYEVELKLPADHDAVRESLREAGATRTRAVTQRDTYYDAPHRDFAETGEALRIREEYESDRRDPSERASGSEQSDVGNGTTKLTYKGPLVEAESKTREEHETGVESSEELRAVLDGLGFEPAAVVEKERTFYEFGDYTVTLDAVTGLGDFLEVETEVETESAVAAARDRARERLRDLGLDPDETIRTSYLGLLFEAGVADDG